MHSSVLLVSADWNHRCVAEAAVDGHAIRTVPSYREALNVLGRWGVRLLFCDDALHDGNWRDILSHVAITPDPPRVVVLASSERIIEQARHLGAWEAIRKPVSEAAIRQVIGRAELRGDAARRQKNAVMKTAGCSADRGADLGERCRDHIEVTRSQHVRG